MEIHYNRQGRINLADFSRRAGFSSRSYVSELMAGKKGLSKDSIRRMREALRLPKNLGALMELLALRENPKLARSEASLKELELRITELRRKISEGTKPPPVRSVERMFSQPKVLQVFAALGSPSKGASRTQIAGRTGLNQASIGSALKILLSEGAAFEKDSKYYCTQNQIDLFGLKSKDGLKTLVTQACAEVQRKSESLLASRSNLMFYTTLSVDSHRLPSFRQHLKEAIYEVLDRYQNDEGDCVMQVLFSAYGPTGDEGEKP